MRARFDGAYIRAELERIGQQLDNPLAVFLIIHAILDAVTSASAS